MLSGQGADELFAGYKRYESLSCGELENCAKKSLGILQRNNLERDDTVTMANSVESGFPTLTEKSWNLLAYMLRNSIHNRIRNIF